MYTRKWVGLGIAVVVIALMCSFAFAGVSDAIFERNRPSESKGWSVYSEDTDIDTTAELVTQLATTYAQLAADDNVFVSSADNDDASQYVTIYGINSAGNKAKESILITGTATADTVSSTTWSYIDQVSVDAECLGVVSVNRVTGNTFITSIPVGRLDAQMAQHFNGEYFTYLTNWRAGHLVATTDTIKFELRVYPNDASSRTPDTGYRVLDSMTISGASTDERYFAQPIKIDAGSWISIYGTGSVNNTSGNASLQGVDLKQ